MVFNNTQNPYFYQFHVETIEHVKQIGEYLRNRKYSPFLHFCVGVAANPSSLKDKKKRSLFESIYNVCNVYKNFVPVLHFSFNASSNPLEDIKKIRKSLPFFKILQLNDLPIMETSFLDLTASFFLLDIPFFNENFELLQNPQLRNVIKEHNSFILLDNSKGRGIQEPKSELIRKIDLLRKYGFFNIGIYGGFGPYDLDTYFELRKHYQINFSIDAETKLKTDNIIDIEKIKLYLHQLLCFDELMADLLL